MHLAGAAATAERFLASGVFAASIRPRFGTRGCGMLSGFSRSALASPVIFPRVGTRGYSFPTLVLGIVTSASGKAPPLSPHFLSWRCRFNVSTLGWNSWAVSLGDAAEVGLPVFDGILVQYVATRSFRWRLVSP